MDVRRLIPDTIAGRTLIVLILGLTISHVLSMALYLTDRATALDLAGGEHIGERIVTITRLVENASEVERSRVIELADNPTLRVTWSQESAMEGHEDGGWEAEVLREGLIAHFGNTRERTFRTRYVDTAEVALSTGDTDQTDDKLKKRKSILISVQLRDNTWLNFAALVESPAPIWSFRFVLSIVVMVLAVVILSALVVRHLVAPLRVFARAAQRLGIDVNAPPLAEAGPREVRQATRAFNEMQRRIRRFVQDRTQMIAAISHDLRTPITRLRLRADLVDDPDQQEKMLADLDEMESMISSVLSFSRDDAAEEPREVVDLAALMESVCDDLADTGRPVEFRGEGRLPYSCRPRAIRRALINLIENAVKYGERARAELLLTEDQVTVRIDDDGPGIPEVELEKVFEPFYRLDHSRSRETGGTGLGLCVARTIVRAHGGDITLRNLPNGGLRAEVVLPR